MQRRCSIHGIGLWLGAWLVLSALWGCPRQTPTLSPLRAQVQPDERLITLQDGERKRIPIEDNEALIYRFEVRIQRAGLYQFETQGSADTLCALVHGSKEQERFVIVKDTGGTANNCSITWAFPPGTFRFKVRVDGHGAYHAHLKRLTWGPVQTQELQRNHTHEGVLPQISHRHRFHFRLRAPRLVQFSVKSKGTLQCMLRYAGGRWLPTTPFRQTHGQCTLGHWLPKGDYHFDLRSDQTQSSYKLRFQEIRMVQLPTNKLQEGHIHPKTSDLYRIDLKGSYRHIVQSHGSLKLRCRLESPLGHVVARGHRLESGKNRCLLDGQFKPGRYYLRVQLHRQQQRGGPYLVSLRQQKYRQLQLKRELLVRPNFQHPLQLYHFQVKHPQLYRLQVAGRAVHCELHGAQNQALEAMKIRAAGQCQLFAHLQPGSYFLRIYPLLREDKAYRVQLLPYRQPTGPQLPLRLPRLIGPVSAGFNKSFDFSLKQAQLTILETHGELDTHCTLYDANHRVIAKDDDTGRGRNCRVYRYLEAGRYRIAIRVGGRNGMFWAQRRIKTLPWLIPGRTLENTTPGKKKSRSYLLKVNKEGAYHIHTEGKYDTICELFDTSWKSLKRNDDASGNNKNCLLEAFLNPGIYTVKVKFYEGHQGRFRIKMRELPARPLAQNKPHKSSLHPPGWSNLFRFNIAHAGPYTVRTHGTLDTKCRLLNAQGRSVAENDDARSDDKNCKISTNLLPGRYYFQVKLYRSKNFQTRRLYSVSLRAHRSQIPLQLGRAQQGHINAGDIVEYHIHLKQSGSYVFQTQGSSDPKCTLFDARHKAITKDDDSGSQRNCRLSSRLKAGKYIIQVRSASPNQSIRFRIRAVRRP